MSAQAREYQLAELRIAQDPSHPSHLLPPIGAQDRRVLDLGCGAGQTFIALDPGPNRLAVGLDIDLEALRLGKSLRPGLLLVHGSGEALPFRPGSFDLVTSRVAVPYMDLGRTLPELHRVLTPGGRLWCSLHPLRLTLGELTGNFSRGEWRGVVYRLLVLFNGFVLHLFGRQPFPNRMSGCRETFQTVRGIRLALTRAGYREGSIKVTTGRFMIAEART